MLPCLFSHRDMFNDKLHDVNKTIIIIIQHRGQRANELTFASDEEEGRKRGNKLLMGFPTNTRRVK